MDDYLSYPLMAKVRITLKGRDEEVLRQAQKLGRYARPSDAAEAALRQYIEFLRRTHKPGRF